MTTKISLIFYIRKSKINANGQVPIYQRITIEGKRYEISTGQFVEEAKWSSEAGRVKGNSEEARSINNRLDMVKSKVFDVERRLFMSNTQINFENFKNEYLGKKERERTLIPIFIEHNRKIKELVGSEYALGTLERYETSLKHTKAFLQWKYNISDIDITKIDHAFITEYEFYLRTERKCANNTAVKYIKNFHKIINICLANGWLIKDPFANYKSKVKEVIREFLTEQEIQEIMNKEFVTERLEQIRDIFVFSCFTGLAYIDVKQLTNNNIVLGIDGDKWINKNRQKTDTNSKIPLLPTAQYILDKYAEHPVCLNEGNLLPVHQTKK
uniref:site-specific integrase n=1 Tax=Flavobacterium haoranii TaxID=683124 RepID=UPI0029395237|nr:site-specific integrase [Flavobacterium haoranii]